MNSFERARKPEQKQQRLDAILAATAKLMDDCAFSEITMRQIAGEAGLGKASLYHYFQTKEEVFLSLCQRDIHDWSNELETRLRALRKPNPDRVAIAIVKSLTSNPRCARQMVLLSTVIENNVSSTVVQSFKLQLLEPMAKLVALLTRLLPETSTVDLEAFPMRLHVLVAGLWPLSHPNDVVAEALAAPELAEFRIDFASQCHAMLVKLLSPSH